MSLRETVVGYLKQMSIDERKRIEIMLEHGIGIGTGYAEEHDINPMLFESELRDVILGEK